MSGGLGGSVEVTSLQELALVSFEDLFTCDIKADANCIARLNTKPSHQFGDVAEVATAAGEGPGGRARCGLHQSCCQLPRDIDLLICGPPCAPYSTQRAGRQKGLLSQKHIKQTQARKREQAVSASALLLTC